MLTDNYGRQINYARLSVTNACNLRCLYCAPPEFFEQDRELLKAGELLRLAEVLAELGIDKLRITGGEPLVREDLIPILYGARQINKIKTLALTTNGILLAKYLKDLKSIGLDALNISLDSLQPDKFRQITGGAELSPLLETIHAAVETGFNTIKINTVLIKDFNDNEIEAFVKLTEKMPIDVRFIELMPIGLCAPWTTHRYISAEKVLNLCDGLVLQENASASSPAVYYKLPSAKGRVGLIRAVSCKFCQSCNRIRITADGKLKGCLHTDDEIDIRQALISQDDELLRLLIKEAVQGKPPAHNLEQGNHVKRNMPEIGG